MAYQFLNGVSMGLLIAMPFGIVDMLCIRNTLLWGIRYGITLGLGVAAADALCGSIAGFGVASLNALLKDYGHHIQLLGGLFLCLLGLRQLSTTIVDLKDDSSRPNMASVFSTGFLIIATNPSTLISFLGIFAAFGVELSQAHPGQSSALISGIFFGSALWWCLLSSSTSLFRRFVSLELLGWLNKSIGILFIMLGILVLLHIVYA